MNNSLNHEVFLSFSLPSNAPISPIGPFTNWNDKFPHPFIYILQLVKSLPFHIPDSWKKDPFRTEPSCIGYREYPAPRALHHANLNQFSCFADKFFQLAWEDIHWDNAYACKYSARNTQSYLCFRKKVKWNQKKVISNFETLLAWENSWHFATLPLIYQRNDVWETSAEIPYWRRVTTQIWVVTRHQYGISALVSQTSFRW